MLEFLVFGVGKYEVVLRFYSFFVVGRDGIVCREEIVMGLFLLDILLVIFFEEVRGGWVGSLEIWVIGFRVLEYFLDINYLNLDFGLFWLVVWFGVSDCIFLCFSSLFVYGIIIVFFSRLLWGLREIYIWILGRCLE